MLADRTAADDLSDVVRQLGAFIPVDQIPRWLLAPREELGGRTPVHLVAAGELRDVYALIRTDYPHPDGVSPDGLPVVRSNNTHTWRDGSMNSASAAELLRFATTLEGERIPTLAGRAAFRLRVMRGGIEITPESTGKPRLVSRDMIERVLGEYDVTRSRSPGHYQAITFDASYLLAIIDRLNRQRA